MVKVRTETKTIEEIRHIMKSCQKPQYQRCAHWSKRSEKGKLSFRQKPSMEEYIKYLCTYQHSIEPIVIGKNLTVKW